MCNQWLRVRVLAYVVDVPGSIRREEINYSASAHCWQNSLLGLSLPISLTIIHLFLSNLRILLSSSVSLESAASCFKIHNWSFTVTLPTPELT